jgi:kumamolisin
MAKNAIAGSERAPLRGAQVTGKADPNEQLEVTVLLRRGNAPGLKQRVEALANRDATAHLTREEFEKQYRAASADIAAVRKFAAANGLKVVQEDAGRRAIVLSGAVAQFNAAFGVDLQKYQYPGGSYRGRIGSVKVPDELKDIVEAVLGLDNRPVAAPHFRTRHPAAAATSYTPLQIASFYNFPIGTGQGQCVGIIELGGGEKPADLTTYFSKLGLKKRPKVTTVSVDHAKNKPAGGANGPDGEVMLDIEVVGAVAPEAHIVVYFAPNTDAGFLNAITTAVHDSKNKPSVISISWGGPESSWTPQSLTAFDSAFQAAATMGVTVCVASGDGGSGDGVGDGADHVDFPASSPHALACGGTNIQVSGGAITTESVWNDGPQGGAGGGGVSAFFALPQWQNGLHVKRAAGSGSALGMRGVPDVSGDADPQSGYVVRVDGVDMVIGGTSAVAPLWAGLIARINAAEGGPVGFVNPILYGSPSALNDVTNGDNGSFVAASGWDACTGLGSPDGVKVASLLGAAAQIAKRGKSARA